MRDRSRRILLLLSVAIVLLLCGNVCLGSVSIPFKNILSVLTGGTTGNLGWDYIILHSRIPSAITAMLAGMALASSGLMLQTTFRNPLAGPDILGINGGAGLGVALVMMALGGNIQTGNISLGGTLSIFAGAFAGAMIVTAIILLLSSRLRTPVMLLIAGIMVSYLTSSVISLLNFFSAAEGVHSYVLWGMGNFAGVSSGQLPYFSILTLAGLIASLMLVKPLNAMLLGDYYAGNLGINVRRTRTLLLLVTGVLVAVTTAYCGPVSFLGLAVPHIARLILKSGNLRCLMPVTILSGAAISLVCNLVSCLPGDRGVIPLNAITPAIGAPVVLYVLLKQYRSVS